MRIQLGSKGAGGNFDFEALRCLGGTRRRRSCRARRTGGPITVNRVGRGLPRRCREPGGDRGIELARIHFVMGFDDVYTEFQPKIHRFLCRFVGPDEAEDLTQEVFLKISQALPEFRGDSTLSTWVYRIASNSALDRLRRRASRRFLEVPLTSEERPTDRSPDGEHRVFRREMRQCLDRFIEKLPPNYRSTFVLSEYEELTNPEIAAALGISLDAVKIRMHRACQLLQVELRARCRFSRDARNELVCEPNSSPVSVRG